jgi:ssDNA-binding Zn-finger/Zn-ribbon topoisomerase 1
MVMKSKKANSNQGYDGPTIPCDKCDGEMQLKTGRFGPYFACTSCDNTRKVLKMVNLHHRVLIRLKWNTYVQLNMMIFCVA